MSAGITVPYSFWPAKLSRRWKLQRRLYAKDPWATLFEAVYRTDNSRSRNQEALSYLGQAEEYFDAATQRTGRLTVKPVLLYYSLLNLGKCLLAVRAPGLDLSRAMHGLTADRTGTRAILGDQVKIRTSTTRVNIFSELMNLLEGSTTSNVDLQVRHLLPQILPGHRLWTYASGKNELFISSEIRAMHSATDSHGWLEISVSRGELAHLGKSVEKLISASGLPGEWAQISSEDESLVVLEQQSSMQYNHRPLDCVQELFGQLKPHLWLVVTANYPHRRYYLNVQGNLGRRRLPQWASIYVLFFYLSDLTRYRPKHFDRFLESKYGPQIEAFLDETPRQFLYMMASELLEREIAPAALV